MGNNQKTNKRTPRIRQHDNLLYETLQYTGNVVIETLFTITTFDAKTVDKHNYHTVSDVIKAIDDNKTNWICVQGLADTKKIEKLCSALNVPVLWAQDILNVRHISKIEFSQQKILTILDIFGSNIGEPLGKEHISLLLMPNTVVSFQETTNNYFQHIQEAIMANSGQVRHQNTDYLYNLLLSRVVDNYLAILDHQRDEMLTMEDTLMEFTGNHTNVGRDIQNTRKDYLLLRKNILPLCSEFHKLLKDAPLIIPSNHIYYKDTYDHLEQVAQLIENAKENIAALVDLYMANNDLRMNHIMSRLTVLSAIFIPLTFLVGVWGMNFKFMPELNWTYGYLFAWGTMAITAIGVIIWLWRQKWF
ncbi:MAG: magnesium/cobalt transporter CorA [Sphingobacteriia bacterium]|jgi:magnesium transporter|nr:magnesium/cobalt transporter CorA [Paludibacteraceae bacterium]NCA80355.1 magnesium/cobalt transporter CorA [Sphingobacteriia bacterium]